MKHLTLIILFSSFSSLLISQDVGINETSPQGKLHIKTDSGTNYPQLRLTENHDDYSRIKLENTAFTSFWDIAGRGNDNEFNGKLNFYFKNPSTSGDIMTIQGNGKVGINNLNPGYTLDIKSKSEDPGAELQITTPSNNYFLRLFSGSTSFPHPLIFYKSGTDLRFGNDGGGFSEKMRLTSDGKLGLGTVSPISEVDIKSSDPDDGVEIHLSNSNTTHFLRLFSGQLNVPDPIMYWNHGTALQLGFANADESNYQSFLRLNGKTIEVLNTGGSIYIGEGAGEMSTFNSSRPNIAIGRAALKNSMNRNQTIAIGDSTLVNNAVGATSSTHGKDNMGVGFKSLKNNTIGNTNLAIGLYSLSENMDGSLNTSIGQYALQNNNSSFNVAIGGSAMRNAESGGNNTSLGYQSLFYTDGSQNTAVGNFSMLSNSTGSQNTTMGNNVMYYNETGQNNVVIGYKAGYGQSGNSYSGNVLIGNQAGENINESNRLYIDNSNIATPLIYGEFNNNLVRINGKLNATEQFDADSKIYSKSLNVLEADGSGVIIKNDLSGKITWGPTFGTNYFTNDVKIGGTTLFLPGANLRIQDPVEPSFILATGEGTGHTEYWHVKRNSSGIYQWFHSTFHKMSLTPSGKLGIGIDNPNAELDVSGSIEYTGTITDVSDIRYKKNISDLSPVSDKVLNIRPVKYEMRRDEFPEMRFDNETEIGVIGQELELLFPELVKTNKEGFKSVDYTKLSVILIKAHQEQSERIDKQEKIIEMLVKEVEELKNKI